MVLDLEDYLSKFKRHLDSVHTLSRDQQLADLYHTFEISPVASTERNEAFQTLKSMLQSTVNSSIESRTTILDKSGKVVVDDVDDHEEETCSSCHSLRDDVDVMTSKLKSVDSELSWVRLKKF